MGNFRTSGNGTILAHDQNLVIEAWSVEIGAEFNLAPGTLGLGQTTGNLYIDACPGATALMPTPGMDVAIGSPSSESNSGANSTILTERFQLSASSLGYITARDVSIGGAIQRMNLYSIGANQTSSISGQLLFSTSRLTTYPATSPTPIPASFSASMVVKSSSTLNLASRLGVHFESAGGVVMESSSWSHFRP